MAAASIGDNDGSFTGTLPRQRCSVVLGRSDHPTEGAKELGGSLRSDRLLSHSDGAFLHTQPFSNARLGRRLLSAAHRWGRQVSVCFELRGVATHGVRDTG